MISKTIIFTFSNFCQTGIFQSWCPWRTGRHARWKIGEDYLNVPSLLQRLLNAQGVPQNVWSEVRASPIVVLILSCHPLAKANRKKRWWSNILLLPAELESPSSSVTWESICSWETGLGGDSTRRYKKTHSLKNTQTYTFITSCATINRIKFDSRSSLIFCMFFFTNRLGCSFYFEDHVHFLIKSYSA